MRNVKLRSHCTHASLRPKRTMESVAEPAPALASTTSVPASWMRFVRASILASSKLTFGVVCSHHNTEQLCLAARTEDGALQ